MRDYADVLLKDFQVRKSPKEKERFRTWLMEELRSAGYVPHVEERRSWGIRCRNVVAGDPEKAAVLVTAHYDTCAVLPVPNFITPRNMVWYLLWQLVLVAGMLAVMGLVYVLTAWLTDSTAIAILTGDAAMLGLIWWMLDGRANRHTANDNTSGVVTILTIAMALPAELREKVCFVFFDNEEKGLLGSAAFAGAHKKIRKNTLVLNFDCVSDGEFFQFFPSKALKKNGEALLEKLEESFPSQGGKQTEVVRSFGFYPSDQANFTRGIGICALNHSRIFGYYMDRIHTGRDTVMDKENIRLFCQGTTEFLRNL